MKEILKVLLIEDSEDDAILIQRELEKSGFSIDPKRVYSAEKVEEAFRENGWDLILSDYYMPQFTGLQVLEMYKKANLEIPFLLVSRKIGEEVAVEAIKYGIHDYVRKNELIRLGPAVKKELKDAEDRIQKKAALAALKVSEEKYRTLTENLSIGIYRTQPEGKGKLLESNSAMVRMFGYDNKEDFFRNLPADLYQNPKDRDIFRKRMENEESVKNMECAFRKKNGDIFIASETALAVKDDNGEILYIDGMIEDITERKNLEMMLLQSEKMASIGTLAAGIAHEINNPLGYIYSNLKILKQYQAKFAEYIQELNGICQTASEKNVDPGVLNRYESLQKKHNISYFLEDMKEAIDESISGTEKVTGIVSDLKDFSRNQNFEIAETNINELIDKTINIVWNEIKYKAEVVKNYGTLPPVECDSLRISQVLVNLFMNAAQAIEKQGVITVTTEVSKKIVSIKIQDTGCGIPEVNQAKIFDAFYTTKEPGEGTGLGLSISYKIITEHGGKLMVSSEVGSGSEFTVKLPVKFQEKCLEKRILVVDDEDIILTTLEEIIHEDYPLFDIKMAKDGFTSGSLIKSFQPDIVFMDIKIPGMDGIEVCNYISGQKQHNETSIVLFTGYPNPEIEEQAIKAGADYFLRKPLKKSVIKKIIENICKVK